MNKLIDMHLHTTYSDGELTPNELIKKAIHEKFSQCTVITITHRLSNIIDSDKIMVRPLPVEFQLFPFSFNFAKYPSL